MKQDVFLASLLGRLVELEAIVTVQEMKDIKKIKKKKYKTKKTLLDRFKQ